MTNNILGSLILLACVGCTLGLAADQIVVPGDVDGDKIVSAEELQKAEDGCNAGKITSEELAMIRMIHDSYPRTFTDSSGKEIDIYKPISRIAVLTTEDYEILRTLNATDRVVAASKYVVLSREMGSGDLYADGSGYINIGSPTSTVDWEALIEANPDIVITYMTSPKPEDLAQNLKETNITVIRWDSGNISQYLDIVKTMGYLLDRNESADEYCRFFEDKLGRYLNAASDLSVEQKPRVYLEADFGGGQTYYTCGSGHAHNALIMAAGGENIFADLQGFKQVDPESVAILNPQVILRYKYLKDSPGIEKSLDDTAALKGLRDEMLSRPELNRTEAVQDGMVYVFTWDCTKGGGRFYLGMGYLGKWLQPQMFNEYDPRQVYQEYLEKFQGADVDVINQGVFVYPEA